MNRNLTLILSAVLVVVLLGIWIYLMFFADQSEQEGVIVETGDYAEFDGLGGDAPAGSGAQGQSGPGSGMEGGDASGEGGTPAELPLLRQLTTRNVAGYKEVEIASSSQIIFMESGVGHIYKLELDTGNEERLSATTIPDTRAADFSNDGRYVAVKSGASTGVNPLLLATIDYDNNTVATEPVAEQVGEFAFTTDGQLLYTVVGNSSVVAQVYDPETTSTERLFETPFREARVLFGETVAAEHYFFPKTSQYLEGFVYQVDGGELFRLPIDGFGFTTHLAGNKLVVGVRDNSSLDNFVYDPTVGELTALSPTVLPSKCVWSFMNLYCAAPSDSTLRHDSIDEWNQGLVSYADNLWSMGTTSSELVNITNESGRNVDVKNGSSGQRTGNWYFQNKIDNTLWVYELSRLPNNEMIVEENI